MLSVYAGFSYVQLCIWCGMAARVNLGPVACMQVSALLDGSRVWQAYCHQRHDLFLPSGSTATGSVVGLLTGPDTEHFGLPAAEAIDMLQLPAPPPN